MCCLLTREGARARNTVLTPLLFLPFSCPVLTHPHPIQQQEFERLYPFLIQHLTWIAWTWHLFRCPLLTSLYNIYLCNQVINAPALSKVGSKTNDFGRASGGPQAGRLGSGPGSCGRLSLWPTADRSLSAEPQAVR